MQGFVYLFDVQAGPFAQWLIPGDNVIDLVLSEHDTDWCGFVVRDKASSLGMLWLTSGRP